MEKVKILSIVHDTHNVVHIKAEKPEGFSFKPGQAVDVALDNPEWKNELRPFTFTSLPSEENLEFYIKTYTDHEGVTKQIGKLKAGDYLLLGEVFGAIQYKGEGIFIAGGAGLTPMLAILRSLKEQNKIAQNKLIFANKKEEDIIAKELLESILGQNLIHILSVENKNKYAHGFINKDFIQQHLDNKESYFYVCGPDPMMEAVLKELKEMGVDSSKIVVEE